MSNVQRPSGRMELVERRVRMLMAKSKRKFVIHRRVVRKRSSEIGKNTVQFAVPEIPVESQNRIGREISSSLQGHQSIKRPHLVLLNNFIQNIRVLGARTSHLLKERARFLESLGTQPMGVNYLRLQSHQLMERAIFRRV